MAVEVAQRDIWWADLADPLGSESGFVRPVVIVQNDAINISRLSTYLCIPLSGSAGRKPVPWNLPLPAKVTGLDRDSVAQTTLMFAVNREQLIERAGRISPRQLQQLFESLDIALGRSGH